MKKEFDPQRTQEVIPVLELELLNKLIATPSYCGDEGKTACLVERFLQDHYVFTVRKHNNVFCYNLHFDHARPTILLTSPHNTVNSTAGYGMAMISLIGTFLHFFKRRDLPYNLCLAITSERECTGEKGIKDILKDLLPISFAIVGAPARMQEGKEEGGSMVLDCTSFGRVGHAAMEEVESAGITERIASYIEMLESIPITR